MSPVIDESMEVCDREPSGGADQLSAGSGPNGLPLGGAEESDEVEIGGVDEADCCCGSGLSEDLDTALADDDFLSDGGGVSSSSMR